MIRRKGYKRLDEDMVVSIYIEYTLVYPEWWNEVDIDDPEDPRVDEILDTPHPWEHLKEAMTAKYPDAEVLLDTSTGDRDLVEVRVEGPLLDKIVEVINFIQKVMKSLNVRDIEYTWDLVP